MYDCGSNALYYDIPAVASEVTVDNNSDPMMQRTGIAL